jgi:hypothetical protein
MPQKSDSTWSARQLLVSWANEQDGWARLLVGEVLATRQPVSADALDKLYGRYLSEKGLSDNPTDSVHELSLDESSVDDLGYFALTKLSEVVGVNAIAVGQEIEFNPGLTVLFGENGAGKTGYARVLKRVAAVRGAEPILSDVHNLSGVATTPTARIDYSLEQVAHTLQWTDEVGVHPFTHLSIFDSPALLFHVDGDQTYLYTPSDLGLFKHCADGITGVCKRDEEDVVAKTPKANPFLAQFQPGTRVYQMVETLGPATDLGELQELALVSAADKQSLQTRRERIAALQPQATRTQLSVARNRLRLHERLVELAQMVRGFSHVAYNVAIDSATKDEEEYRALQTRVLGAGEVNEETRASWHDFVLSGSSYAEHRHGDEYPQRGKPCIYCRQSLDEQAVELIAEYRTLLSDKMRHSIGQARTTARTSAALLTDIDPETIWEMINNQKEADGPNDTALLAAEKLLVLAAPLISQLAELKAVEWEPLLAHAELLLTESVLRVDAATSLIEALTAKHEERAKRLDEEVTSLADIENCLLLASQLGLISSYIRDAKWALKLKQLVKKLQPIQRSLTERAKQAGEQLLHTDFVTRFEQECKVLRAPMVRLEFPGKHGEARRRKVVTTHKPSAVLSEGEQKVIALADFLAEAGLRTTPAPVVFDDPVNSLDYRRIHEVSNRVALLAKERQVVVFTHNIWFATELLARFEKDPGRCTYYTVTDENQKGVILRGSHPRWDSVSKLRKRVDGLIKQAAENEGDDRELFIEAAYSCIRSWCEVVVEQELLHGVCQRYQPNVMLTALPKIRGDRLTAATDAIYPVYEKACRVMEGHSQPLESLSVRPLLSEVKKDWADITAALAAYKVSTSELSQSYS